MNLLRTFKITLSLEFLCTYMYHNIYILNRIMEKFLTVLQSVSAQSCFALQVGYVTSIYHLYTRSIKYNHTPVTFLYDSDSHGSKTIWSRMTRLVMKIKKALLNGKYEGDTPSPVAYCVPPFFGLACCVPSNNKTTILGVSIYIKKTKLQYVAWTCK